MNLIDLIAVQTSHNALYAIESVAMGYTTPLIDSEGLADHVELIKADTRTMGLDAVRAELGAQHRAVNAAKTTTTVGRGKLGGVGFNYIEIRDPTVEEVAAHRKMG